MMKAIDVLIGEHRVIELVLNCLSKLADRCEADGEIDSGAVLDALDFFRHFADECHHGKEEDHLFKLLEARGLAREGGPIGVMLHEHQAGRRLLAAMACDVESQDASEFVRHARDYVKLLRDHIQKEDQCLFPLAASVLSDAEGQSLMQSFEQVEVAEMGPGAHERFLQSAASLADWLGVDDSCRALTAQLACCSHHAVHEPAVRPPRRNAASQLSQ